MDNPTAASPISLTIDHVTIAGSDLARMQQAFARLGLATDYGGAHSNNLTHMALLGFNDGSYVELISWLKPGQKDAVFWGEHIADDGGPCAWAVQVDEVAAEAARMAALGVTVTGPTYYHRRRPDGRLVEWDLAILGDQGAGAVLPFIIKDITPREWRVQPSASVADGLLSGVVTVVLGVKHLQATIALFQRVYHWPPPQMRDDPHFGARLAAFTDTPVVVAAPLPDHPWLAERLTRLGESPCAFLLGATDFEAACQRFGLRQRDQWFGRRLAWFDPAKLAGVRLGIVEEHPPAS